MSINITDHSGTSTPMKTVLDGTDHIPSHNVDNEGKPWLMQVVSGDVTGTSTINKFGENPDVDIASCPEAIWSHGGAYPNITAAATLTVSSTDAKDNLTGGGAQKITIQGLDENWDEASEVVEMNGTNETTATSTTFIRVYRAFVSQVGTEGFNTGEIDITHTGISAVVADIPAGDSQTLMAVYTVPAGKTAQMLGLYVSMEKDGKTTDSVVKIKLQSKSNAAANQALRTKHSIGLCIDGTSTYTHQYAVPKKFTEKTDIYLNIVAVSKDSTSISGGFDIILEDN